MESRKYTDDYRHALLNVIHEKIESGGKTPAVHGVAKKPTNVVDLVSVLQQSLEHAEKSAGTKRKLAPQNRKLRKAA